MEYLANLCFVGSGGKRNKRQRKATKNDQNIIVSCIAIQFTISQNNEGNWQKHCITIQFTISQNNEGNWQKHCITIQFTTS